MFYDWHRFFDNPATIPAYYPPWTAGVSFLPLWLILAVTVLAFVWAAYRQANSLAIFHSVMSCNACKIM